MTKHNEAKPNLSSTTFFFGCAVILILVSLMLTVGQTFERTTVRFGTCEMQTQVARTNQEKAKGLSGQLNLDDNEAMAFPFEDEQPGFWMKDMLFSIDIVWVDNGRVVQVNDRLPLDDGATVYHPDQPIDWVVEVAAGRAEACGVYIDTPIQGLRS